MNGPNKNIGETGQAALKSSEFFQKISVWILIKWLCRLVLALVFTYAAWDKILDPAGFALSIDNYRLFPLPLIGPMAIFLPWLEIWAALMLFVKRWRRAAALILGALLITFILAVGFNLLRGLDFECGCFGSGGRQAGLILLIQDGMLLICALYVFKKD